MQNIWITLYLSRSRLIRSEETLLYMYTNYVCRALGKTILKCEKDILWIFVLSLASFDNNSNVNWINYWIIKKNETSFSMLSNYMRSEGIDSTEFRSIIIVACGRNLIVIFSLTNEKLSAFLQTRSDLLSFQPIIYICLEESKHQSIPLNAYNYPSSQDIETKTRHASSTRCSNMQA